MHEARYYTHLSGGKVLCTLCHHDCSIPGRMRGAMGMG